MSEQITPVPETNYDIEPDPLFDMDDDPTVELPVIRPSKITDTKGAENTDESPAEPEPGLEPAPAAEPAPEFEPEVTPAAAEISEPASGFDPVAQSEYAPEPTVEPEPEVTSGATEDPESAPAAKPEPESEWGSAAKPELEPEFEGEPEPESEPEPKPKPEPEPEPTAQSEFADGFDAAKEPNAAAEPRRAAEPAPAAQLQSEPGPNAAAQPDPKASPESTAVVPIATTNAEVTINEEDLEAQLAYQRIQRSREARKRKRIIMIVAACVVALIVAVWFVVNGANEANQASEEDIGPITSVVMKGDFETVISANGATEPLASTIVTPEVDGIIENVQIEEGKYVNEGDELFYIKNDELDKAVAEAERNQTSAQRALDSARRAVDDAYAAYQRSWDAHNASGDWSTFDEAGLRSAITTAENTRDDAQVALDAAGDKVDEARARADKRVVRAPVSGSIVTMNAVNGASVGNVTGSSGNSGQSQSSGPLVQISDLSQMKVTVQVNELDISTISAGQAAKATFSAIDGLELDATVQRIASTSTGSGESGGSGGVVTYAVDLLIPDPDPRLKPGMTATVRITTQSVPDTLKVPVAAVQTDGSGSYVTVVDGDNMRKVSVEVKAKNSSDAAIAGDLQEGNFVLLSGGGTGDDATDDAMLSGDATTAAE